MCSINAVMCSISAVMCSISAVMCSINAVMSKVNVQTHAPALTLTTVGEKAPSSSGRRAPRIARLFIT